MPHRSAAPADGQRGHGAEGPDAATDRPASREERGTPAEPRRGAAEGLKAGAAGLPATAEARAGHAAPQGETAADQTREGRKVTPTRPVARPAAEAGQDDSAARPVGEKPSAEKEPGAEPDAPRSAPTKPGGGKRGKARPAPKEDGPSRAAADARGGDARPVPRPASRAKPRARHGLVLLLFLVMVVLPVSGAAWYLYARATDQYASTLGFSVRKEEGPSASELLGGIASLSGASSSDTDVLNEFIQSQDMVERVDATLDLRAIYSWPERDPIFTLEPDATIEELVDYWNRMVTIYYDGGVGLIEVRVLAFRPEDARAIAREIFDESSRMINDLTAIARADATRYARQELDAAVERLRVARSELTEFRTRTQIVDPAADIQGQMGLLNTLQAQLAESLIELDLLGETTRESDPRARQTEQRIAVIEKRIAEERAKFGISDNNRTGQAYASLVGEYESLVVNREFAESAYLTALTNFDAAQAEASRQSRYLAAHISPTLAQSSGYPQRATILATFALFAAMAWATASLIYYSVRDRR